MLDLYFKNSSYCIDYTHTRTDTPQSVDFHIHDRFEIYFFISGDVNYFIEKKVYQLKYGDLLVMNSNEIHKAYFKSDKEYQRIVIHFDPAVARLFSPSGFNLLHCFTDRIKGEQNKINLNRGQIDEILKLFHKIENVSKNPQEGADIIKLTSFIELLVLINRVFLNIRHGDEHPNLPDKLIPVFEHINSSLESDLSLEALEQKFFINRFYLSRMFKKSTGINIHEYILFRRISEAKKLLADGRSVTETCQMTGFNDYSNFIRIFKRIVGIPPGKYKVAGTGRG